AEHVMLDEELGEYGYGHIEACDSAESGQLPHIFVHRYCLGLAQGLLDQIVEIAEPFVDSDVEFHLVPGRKQDQRCAGKSPGYPPAEKKEGRKHGPPRLDPARPRPSATEPPS